MFDKKEKKQKTVTATVTSNFNFRPYMFYIIGSLLVAAIGATVQTILLWSYYDETFGLYTLDTNVPSMLGIGMFIATLACFTMLIFVCKAKYMPQELPRTGFAVNYTATLTGFAFPAMLILNLLMGLNISSPVNLVSGLKIGMLISCIPAGYYFLEIAFSNRKRSNLICALGFFPVIWAAFYLMYVYFDSSRAFNDPIRIISQVSLITVMMYFLLELRIQVGRAKTGFYLLFSCLSVIFCALSAIPQLVMAIAMQWNVTKDTVFAAVEFCLMLYIISRYFTFSKLRRFTVKTEVPAVGNGTQPS